MVNPNIFSLQSRIAELINETEYYKKLLEDKSALKRQEIFEKEVKKIIQSNTRPHEFNLNIPVERFYDALFHLKSSTHSDLNPRILVKSFNVFRSPPRLVISIPTIYREKHNYLVDTIKSLLENITPEEKPLVKFVVVFAELNYENAEYLDKSIDSLKSTFKEFIDDGLFEAIMPPEHWYPPDLKNIPPTFNDSQERMFWRTKQCLDYVYSMLYARYFYADSEFYVQLEDDVLTIPGYVSAMIHYATTHSNWLSCDFSTLGFIGKLFRITDLPLITDFTLLFYREKPVDWIFDQLFLVKYCHHEEGNCIKKRINGVRRLYRKPPLFQHVGHFSSLSGKTQNLKEKSFKKKSQYVANVTKSNNPEPVLFKSSIIDPNLQENLMKFYKNGVPFTIDHANKSHFIAISYDNPLYVKVIRVNYGHVFPYSSKPACKMPFNISIIEFNTSTDQPTIDMIHNIETLSVSSFHHKFETPAELTSIRIQVVCEVTKLMFYSITIY